MKYPLVSISSCTNSPGYDKRNIPVIYQYFQVRGAFNSKVESIPTSREAACEVINAREVLKSRLAIVVQVYLFDDSYCDFPCVIWMWWVDMLQWVHVIDNKYSIVSSYVLKLDLGQLHIQQSVGKLVYSFNFNTVAYREFAFELHNAKLGIVLVDFSNRSTATCRLTSFLCTSEFTLDLILQNRQLLTLFWWP